MGNDLTFQILKIAVSVCASLITLYVVPYIYQLQKNKKYAQIVDLVSVAVRAAEQTIKESGQGAVKKEQVMTFVREWLGKRGVEITDEQLGEIVEGAVWTLKQEQK